MNLGLSRQLVLGICLCAFAAPATFAATDGDDAQAPAAGATSVAQNPAPNPNPTPAPKPAPKHRRRRHAKPHKKPNPLPHPPQNA